MEFELERIPDSKSTDNGGDLRKELLCALERARGCLAVRIAAELRHTPRCRREYYLDTAERMRHCIAGLKDEAVAEDFLPQSWENAVEALRKVSRSNSAESLSNRLREVLAALNLNRA